MVTSMAFLRQEEFREELDDAFWDVVVVDEAHKAAKRGESPSKTSKMVERVADNSDSLLLLSATPHDGKGEAFRSLIEYIDPFLVAEDQDLSKEAVDRVMMRRGKQTIYDDDGERIFPNRDVGTIPVEMTHEERQFYRAVTDYVKNVYNRSEQLNEPAVGFAMALMQKRLVSSIGAIKATLVVGSRTSSTSNPPQPICPKKRRPISKVKTSTNRISRRPKKSSPGSLSQRVTHNLKRKSRRSGTSSHSLRESRSTRRPRKYVDTSSNCSKNSPTRRYCCSRNTGIRSTISSIS